MNELTPSHASRAARVVVLCAAAALAPIFAIATSCTSSSEETGPDDASVDAGHSTTPEKETGSSSPEDAAIVVVDGGQVTLPEARIGKDAGAADARADAKDPSRRDAAGLSDACVQYCACYQKKCSVFVSIPTGQECEDFCPGFTKSQFDCRWGMCYYNSAGPDANNNNHCQHAVGIDECL